MTPSGGGSRAIDATLLGTAAAGASVAVRGLGVMTELQDAAGSRTSTHYNSASVATNGTLALQLAVKFDTSNAGNSANVAFLVVEKVSASPLA